MSEEIVNTEKFIIRMLEHSINTYIEDTKVTKVELTTEQAQVLLDLYNKQKEEIKALNSEFAINTEIHKRDMRIKELEEVNNCLHETNKDYISKDEVLKALGYEENDEEYERLYNKEELILSLIRTINEECDRLEDIEDQIDNMRDNYWEDKIRKRLEKLKEKEQELSDEQGYWGSSELQAKIEELEELLGE